MSTECEGVAGHEQPSTSAVLVQIPVPGADDLLAVQTDGRRWVALKPMCETLGIDVSAQLKRLKSKSWATVAVIAVVAADGKVRDMVMVDTKSIPLWLATIDETRVNPAAKPKLIAYQCEAADALHSYFIRRETKVPPMNQLDVLRAALDQIEASQRRLEDHDLRLEALEGKRGWFTVLAFSKRRGLHISLSGSQRLGKAAARIGRAQGINPDKIEDGRFGDVNTWPEWVLDEALAELTLEETK